MIYAIVGPTASGKSGFAVELAKRVDGEILCMDSMQVYRGMDIGTAKIRPEEMQGVPHHLLDIVNPWEEFSVSQYRELALVRMKEVQARGKVPVFCGGTGLYLRSIRYDMHLGEIPSDPALRDMLEKQFDADGPEAFHAALAQVDAESAERLHPNDKRRLIRAMEVYQLTGRPVSVRQNHKNVLTNMAIIGMNMLREHLYSRINARVDCMMQEGLFEEARLLYARHLENPFKTAHQAIGYKELFSCFEGDISREKAVELIQQRSRNYAKRQLTWFRKEEDILWLDATLPMEENISLAHTFFHTVE